MTVLNVLSTNSITAGSSNKEYQVVQTGFYRVSATSAATVSFNGGPAIQVFANSPVLLKGAKPGQAKVVKAIDDSTADYYLGRHIHETSANHPFSVGDYIAVVDNSTSPGIDSNFLSAGTVGKKITAVGTNNMITTDIDSSSASADYTHPDNSTPQAIVQRCVCIEAGTANLVVEEVQVVGG